MQHAGRVLVLLFVGAVVAACGHPGNAAIRQDQGTTPAPTSASTAVSPGQMSTTAPPEPGSDDPTAVPLSGPEGTDRTRVQHAGSVLAAWDVALAAAPVDAVVAARDSAFPGGLTRTSGAWSQVEVSEAVGSAVAAGAFEYLPVSMDTPDTAVVQLPDRTAVVSVIDPETAVAAARADGNGQQCDACPITLVSPVLGSTQLTTVDGTVSVPAWDFTVAGTTAHVIRVAVNRDHLVTPDDVPDLTEFTRSGAGSEVSAARVTGPTSVTVDVYRSNPACGAQLEVIPVETAHTFAVVVSEAGWSSTMTCDARAYPATAEISLAAPVADRTMIDLALGVPVVLER